MMDTYCLILNNQINKEEDIIKTLSAKKCMDGGGYNSLRLHIQRTRKNETHPVEGCLQSHLNVLKMIRDGKNKISKRVFIFEEDVQLNYHHIDFDHLFSTLPSDWKMLFLGYNVIDGSRNVTHPHLLNLKISTCAHAYILNLDNLDIGEMVFELERYDWYDKDLYMEDGITLKNRLNAIHKIRAIDVFYWSVMSGGGVYGLYPIHAYQTPRVSTIEGKMVDYNPTFNARSKLIATAAAAYKIGKRICLESLNEDEIMKARRVNGSDFFGDVEDDECVLVYEEEVDGDVDINFDWAAADWDILHFKYPETFFVCTAQFYRQNSILSAVAGSREKFIYSPTVTFPRCNIPIIANPNINYIGYFKQDRIDPKHTTMSELVDMIKVKYSNKLNEKNIQFIPMFNSMDRYDFISSFIYIDTGDILQCPFFYIPFTKIPRRIIRFIGKTPMEKKHKMYIENIKIVFGKSLTSHPWKNVVRTILDSVSSSSQHPHQSLRSEG